MPTKRTVATGTLLLFTSGTTVVACNKKPTVGFELDVPASIANSAAWYEIGAFSGSVCPPSSQFAGGIPVAGSAAHLAFAGNDPTPPGIGDLPRGTYAFAAAAKADDCGVIAVGCSVVDVGSSDNVKITLRVNDPPTGACQAGAVCQNAQCVPSSDNNDPSVGAGCSLDLLGAGPFADPLAISGTLASAPAISVTSTGFLIAYREYDPVQGVARLTLLPVDASGGAGAVHVETLPNRCADEDESDAIGMALTGDDGLVLMARAPCNGTGGFDLYDVTAAPDVSMSGEETSASLASSVLALSTAHAVAPMSGGYLVALTKDNQALVNTSSGVQFTGTAAAFGGAPPHTGAWVATSDQIAAFLAAGTAAPAPFDAGKSDAAISDSGDLPQEGDGGPQPVLRLNLEAAGVDPTALGAPIEFPGAWGSLAAQGSRLIVASSSDDPTIPVAWRAFDLGKPDPAVQDGFNVSSLGAVSYADVAFHLDNMFFAAETPGAISLVAYNHATTTPTFLREIVLGNNPRIPSLRGLRDGRIAIAASDTRVAITWVTGRELGPDDAVGGYAIFACR
ncbi:MAG: hypothetical protein ABI461_19015 [Polyangiaceae bacterium]